MNMFDPQTQDDNSVTFLSVMLDPESAKLNQQSAYAKKATQLVQDLNQAIDETLNKNGIKEFIPDN